jgi:hypothetical protein
MEADMLPNNVGGATDGGITGRGPTPSRRAGGIDETVGATAELSAAGPHRSPTAPMAQSACEERDLDGRTGARRRFCDSLHSAEIDRSGTRCGCGRCSLGRSA